jgi:hypothetical protein
MNAANDPDLSALGIVTSGSSASTAQNLVNQLACKVTIDNAGASTIASIDSTITPDATTGTAKDNEIPGTFGPFLEEYGVKPTQDKMTGWYISIDKVNQIIEVQATDDATKSDKLVFK